RSAQCCLAAATSGLTFWSLTSDWRRGGLGRRPPALLHVFGDTATADGGWLRGRPCGFDWHLSTHSQSVAQPTRGQHSRPRSKSASMSRKHRVLLIHNIMAPYRFSLFRALAKHPDIELTVWFMSESAQNRRWMVATTDLGFDYQVLPRIELSYFT